MQVDCSNNHKEGKTPRNSNKNIDKNKILCNHCKRTKTNNISCLGICVSDNEY